MRLLAYTSPARGHLYPLVPIFAALAERGHNVAVYTLSSELDCLTDVGVEACAIDPVVEFNQLEDWRKRSRPRAALSVLRTFAERSRYDAPDLTRAIEISDPDVLLVDINCWGAATVAEASGRPWAMYSPYLLPLHSREAPPFGPGLAPMGGPLGKARDALVRRVVQRMFDRAALPPINTLRATYGLAEVDSFAELLALAPLLLSLTAEGFEYPRDDWPANVRLVGPMNWSPALSPVEAASVHHTRDAVPEVASARSTASDLRADAPTSEYWYERLGDPLVLVTCSTEHQRDKRLLHVALEGLPSAGMSVLATSAAHDPCEFDAPAGSMVVRFASHETVLERAACVVCHGGMGIVQKALAACVPVVVVPFGRDQVETARRVEFAQAGVRLSPRQLTPARLREAVQRAMRCREGAKRVSRLYEAVGGALAAAASIETLM